MLDIKQSTLGYRGCVVREYDEEKVTEFPGHPGFVAGSSDAERLIAALACEYPHIPFRIELTPYIVSQIEWERAHAEPDVAPDQQGMTGSSDV